MKKPKIIPTDDRKIYQVGFVVENLEVAMQKWTDLFRIGPWRVSVLSYDTVNDLTVSKNSVTPNFSYRMATTFVGNMQFELMEANETTPIYSEFFKNKGEGIHHIKEQINDDILPKIIEFYEDEGITILYGGRYYNANFYYMDTTQQLSGALIELGNCALLDTGNNR